MGETRFEVVPLQFKVVYPHIVEAAILLPDHLSHFQVTDGYPDEVKLWTHEFTEDALQGAIVKIVDARSKRYLKRRFEYHSFLRSVRKVSHSLVLSQL